MQEYYSWQATNSREPLQKLIQKKNKHTENYMLIKILYCGLCGSDLHLLEGQWDIKFPQTLGHEIIGVVVKLSKKRESDHQIGDVVGVGWQMGACHNCEMCHSNQENLCEDAILTCHNNEGVGGFSEYIAVDPHFAIKIPKSIPLTTAAPMLCSGITAFKPLYENMGKYKHVAIVGLGGVATFAIKFAKTMYETITCISRTEAKRSKSFKLGADSFYNIQQLNPVMFDLILLCSADGVDINNLLKSLKKNGKMVLIGLPDEDYLFSADLLVNDQRTIIGTNTGDMTMMKKMFNYAEKINLTVDVKVWQANQINQAINYLKTERPFIRNVIQFHHHLPIYEDTPTMNIRWTQVSSKSKNIELISRVKCKENQLFTDFEAIKNYQRSQHSLYDKMNKVNFISNSKDNKFPFYLSHSCDPNLRLEMPNKAWAIKDIKPGDLLTIDYRDTEDYLYKQFACNCNSHNCRLWIHGYRGKISEEGRKYLGLDFNQNLMEYAKLEYRNKILHFHDKDLLEIANQFDLNIPLMIYSKRALKINYFRIKYFMQQYFNNYEVLFSIKSNNTPQILSELRTIGLNKLDACSPAEVRRALQCGFTANNIQYTSPFISDLDFDNLRRFSGIKINCDSISMLIRFHDTDIGIRLDPKYGLSYNNSCKLQCSLSDTISKMGVQLDQLDNVLSVAKDNNLKIVRIHVHVGNSYLTKDINNIAIIFEQINSALEFFRKAGHNILEINLGGGFGIPYNDNDKPFDWDKWCRLVCSNLDTTNIKITIEPGDYLVKNSGILLSQVTGKEFKSGQIFIGVNAGMNLNLLPAYYGISSKPLAVKFKKSKDIVNVVGNINESIDIWAKQINIGEIKKNDLIALINSGGYAESCHSNHSLRNAFNTILI